MRIVFIGTVAFSRHCLQQVLADGGNVVAVFTKARESASFHSDWADLSPVAARHRIPVHRVRDINALPAIQQIRALRPDVIFVFGWSQLLKSALLTIPRLGCVGSHPALLPHNRGRHPLVWSLALGLTESGLTFFFLDEQADRGDILWQRAFPIALEDDAATVYAKINALATTAIGEFLPQLAEGSFVRTPQSPRNASYWRKRSDGDGHIRWGAPTRQVYNLVRALARPYVGAHTFVNGGRIRVWKARVPPSAPPPPFDDDLEPGTVIAQDHEVVWVRTQDGALGILEWSGPTSSSSRSPVLLPGMRLT